MREFYSAKDCVWPYYSRILVNQSEVDPESRIIVASSCDLTAGEIAESTYKQSRAICLVIACILMVATTVQFSRRMSSFIHARISIHVNNLQAMNWIRIFCWTLGIWVRAFDPERAKNVFGDWGSSLLDFWNLCCIWSLTWALVFQYLKTLASLTSQPDQWITSMGWVAQTKCFFFILASNLPPATSSLYYGIQLVLIFQEGLQLVILNAVYSFNTLRKSSHTKVILQLMLIGLGCSTLAAIYVALTLMQAISIFTDRSEITEDTVLTEENVGSEIVSQIIGAQGVAYAIIAILLFVFRRVTEPITIVKSAISGS